MINFAVLKHFPVHLRSLCGRGLTSFMPHCSIRCVDKGLKIPPPPQYLGVRGSLTHRCQSLLWCGDLPLCLHCGEKRDFYRQNHGLIPRLAISHKLPSIQIKVSNLLLQKLPGEAVVHLKSSNTNHLSSQLISVQISAVSGGLVVWFVWNGWTGVEDSFRFTVYVDYTINDKSAACLEVK